jgi:tetratricopeptide (TPR) repeat protein
MRRAIGGRLRFFPHHFTEGVTSSLEPRTQPSRYTQELPRRTTQSARPAFRVLTSSRVIVDTAGMAIEDPTAIPETPDQITEYLHEADRLWNDGRTNEAHTLYRSVFSGTRSGPENSLATFRLALYLQSTGDLDGALNFAIVSEEPGARDLVAALRGAMPDQVVDPSNPPTTAEACDRYRDSFVNAAGRSDWTTVEALCRAYQQTTVDVGVGQHALCQMYLGAALVHLGRNDEARRALEWAVANGSSEATTGAARTLLVQIGVHVDDGGNPYETEDSRHLLAGIAAFERGDAAAADTELTAVVDSGDAGATDKGRAQFYLGSMAYHDRRFDKARRHLQAAQANAPSPEQGWATDMLSWRWQE